MLQVIDQRWRDHLAEMDYLREGINLRAMGQQDPLVAWQREGFTMFAQLMESIDDDYLRYVLHVEAVAEPAAEPDLSRAVYEAADDPVAGTTALASQLLADEGVNVAGTDPGLSGDGTPNLVGGPAGPDPTGAGDPGAAGAAARAGVPSKPAARAPGGGRGNGARARAAQAAPSQPGEVRRADGGARTGNTRGQSGHPARDPGTLVAAGSDQKLGRNDPCWCGSGKKFKLCHGVS
jgi:preprotein translocase subunit SecA